MVHNRLERSVPQNTVQVDHPDTVNPAANNPSLSAFRRIPDLREQHRLRAAHAEQTPIPQVMREQAAGVQEPSVGLRPLTSEEVGSINPDFHRRAPESHHLQIRMADRATKLREAPCKEAVRRLVYTMLHGLEPELPTPDREGTPLSTVPEPFCCICQHDISTGQEMTTLQCAHHFHSECIDFWRDYHVVNETDCGCPLCWNPLEEHRRQTREEQRAPDEHHIGTSDSLASVISWNESPAPTSM